MATISDYERLLVEMLLASTGPSIEPGVGLFLMPHTPQAGRVFDCAVNPALQANGLNATGVQIVFDSQSSLRDVCHHLHTAEIILADVSGWSADLAYILGLCHGLARSPLLIAAEPMDLPFNLPALRCFEYRPDNPGLSLLRDQLTRAIRIFLASARAGGDSQA